MIPTQFTVSDVLGRIDALRVPVLAAGVHPRSAKSFNHVAGSVDGSRTNYADLNAFAWFTGGGMEWRGPRRVFVQTTLQGSEDSEKIKR